MRATHGEVERLLEQGAGAVRRSDHRELGGTFDRLLRDRRLVALLPGVNVDPARASDLGVRLAALRLSRPDAVVTGTAAARLTFWPEVAVDTVSAAVLRLDRQPPGYRLERRRLDPELVVEVGAVLVTAPALTALDLCCTLGGDPLDRVLRSRRATLDDLHQALKSTAGRRGQAERRRLVLDSRDEPWSAAERRAHRLLRQAGIVGWTANLAVTVSGTRYFLDIAFPGRRLVIEIDGREFHSDATSFERDRRRQNDLVLAGWTVLRFTWAMLDEQPDLFVKAVRAALR